MNVTDPLVSPEVDCTDLDGFMLNVERLMASELVALSTHEVVGAALFIWCRAWKQKPAASLPDDERVLAAFAKLPLPKFRKLRPEIMRGFVLCRDGRLYHRTLGEEATRAYAKKMAFQGKRHADAERLVKWRASKSETANETRSETRFKDVSTRISSRKDRDGTVRDETLTPTSNALSGKPDLVPKAVPPKPDLTSEAKAILGYLNEKTGRSYQPVEANLSLIAARLQDGATPDELRAVVERKCEQWLNDREMAEYLRPATLFNRLKFAQYQGETGPTARQRRAVV